MQTEKQWLGAVPWQSVLQLNLSLCQTQQLEPKSNATSYETARQLWERAVTKAMLLEQTLDVCRRCYEMAPFTFNNGNTFATIGKALVEDWCKTLSAVESQVVRSTIGHYIAGMIDRKELISVLQFFEESWNKYTTGRQVFSSMPTASSVPAPQPHVR